MNPKSGNSNRVATPSRVESENDGDDIDDNESAMSEDDEDNENENEEGGDEQANESSDEDQEMEEEDSSGKYCLKRVCCPSPNSCSTKSYRIIWDKKLRVKIVSIDNLI